MPERVRRARIHQSVKIVRANAFRSRLHLISVEFHDDIEIIEENAFFGCLSLRGSIKLLGVKVIKVRAFYFCSDLTDVEFGNKLETIEEEAFEHCTSLRNISISHVRTIGRAVFYNCEQLMELDLPEGLETLQRSAFKYCVSLRRIALPLKNGMIGDYVFDNCPILAPVYLVGGIHKTVQSLHLERWRNELKGEINRINETLPTTTKTSAIEQWMRTVISRLEHFKAEHHKMLKEATTLLELALWKANLDDNEGGEGGVLEREGVRTTRGQRKRARKEICVTSGASIVIKNVLPFLKFVS